jgi:hypothetical protein
MTRNDEGQIMEHLTQGQALNYILQKMDEEMLFEVDQHLATCNRCVERVRALRTLQANFDVVWDSWTAKSHGEAYIRERLADALSQAAELVESGEYQNRIKSWFEKIQVKAEAALGIILDSSKRVAEIMYEELEGLSRPDSILQFQPVRLSTEGIGEKAPARISVRAAGPPWAQVEVDALTGNITIEFDDYKKPWPLIILLPKSREQKPIVEILRRQENYLFAEFKGIPDGEYLLLIEPLH